MPFLAEIADKISSVPQMWLELFLLGLVCAALTMALTTWRAWAGVGFVFLAAVLGLTLATTEPTMKATVITELGHRYLLHQRICAFVPMALALVAWYATTRRKHNQSSELTGT